MAQQPVPQQEATGLPYRVSGPTKKGIRSILSGIGAGFGYLIGGLPGLITLGALTAYNGIKSISSLYKSFSKKYEEESSSYFGRGMGRLAKAIGTATVPWLQATISLLSGGYRIQKNRDLSYDYPGLNKFEEELERREAEAARQAEQQETRQGENQAPQ